MATAQPLYHAPVFEPTVDELATLKHLELGQSMGMPEALKQHLSGRLVEHGCITKTAQGQFILTDSGRRWMRRQEG